MKEKLRQQQDKVNLSGTTFDNKTTNLQSELSKRREKDLFLTNAEPVMNPKKDWITMEVEDDFDNAWYEKWPSLIKGKACAIEATAEGISKKIKSMNHIEEGYKQHLPSVQFDTDANENNSAKNHESVEFVKTVGGSK